jgi:carbonic anhydrase
MPTPQPSLLTSELTTPLLLARNKSYIQNHVPAPTMEESIAASGGARLPIPVIVGCFDSRIIPDQFFDLAPGEATVLRNIGGRVNDHMLLQIAALGVLRPLGDVLIVHHEGEL